MANKDYNFQYTPLTGRLPGNSFVKQTEQAINELAGIVNEGAAQVEVITNLANTANDNAEEALEKANEALETAGRVYITLPNLDDADDYYDSQLYYFANSYSANLPVQDTGFLEVKTNDTKTAAEQVFIADTTGLMYMRHGVITSEEVGGETVYSVTWETWSSALASEDYVQQEVNTGVNTANSYTDEQISAEETRADGKYLPLAGGTMTGNIEYVGAKDRAFTASGFSSANKDNVDIGWNYQNGDGALLGLRSADSSAQTGCFLLVARNSASTQKSLIGNPDGTLTWDGQNVITAPNGEFIKFISFSLNGSVAANNWGDYSAEIPFPAGYSHVVGVTKINVPSPAVNMKLVAFYQIGNSFTVRVYSVAELSSTIDITLSVCK